MPRRTPEDRKREFEDTALPHADALFNFALRMARSEKDAEDLVQDTYLRAYRFFDRFTPGTNCRAWLFRILKNVHINGYRKNQRSPDMVALFDAFTITETVTRLARGATGPPDRQTYQMAIEKLVKRLRSSPYFR